MQSLTARLALAAGFALCLGVIVAQAWVSEDAYITFRVIDNFFAGYGLRWNVAERVQVYTHPLWMFLHLPFYALFKNIFIVTLGLGLSCAMLALWMLIRSTQTHRGAALLLVLLPLAASRTFGDYATSGLESSLAFLLFALFVYCLLRYETHPKHFFYCALLAGLAMLNRLDAVLLYGPCLLHLSVQRGFARSLKPAFCALSPLLLWLAFSLFYYGTPLPNTAYAKLGSGLPVEMQWEQGSEYFRLFPLYDLPASVWLFALLPLVTLWLVQRRHEGQNAALALLGVGALSTLVYVCYAGGDYMQGRFFALPLFVCHALVFVTFAPHLNAARLRALALLMALGYGWFAYDMRQCPACYSFETVGTIIDARHAFKDNSLIASTSPLKLRGQGEHGFREEGIEMRGMAEPKIKMQNHIGMAGYYAGPEVMLVDMHGLSDPLLARLPASPSRRFYAGHFPRPMPRGYLVALHTANTEGMHPALAAYYAPLQLMTRGSLFSWERMKTIIAFQLGFYDDKRDDYLRQ